MDPGDYQEFLESVQLLFKAAVKAEDWRVALQVKTLEARCRGFFNKSREIKKITSLSDEDLKEILGSIRAEIASSKIINNKIDE